MRKKVIAKSGLDVKLFLMAALQDKILEYETQHDAADALEVSQPTVSNIINGKFEKFRHDYLMNLLFKTGAKIQLSLR